MPVTVKEPGPRRARVVGVGATALSRDSGVTVLELALEAALAACRDAGVAPAAVDGVLSYHMGDSAPVITVVDALGLDRVRWHNEIFGGGSQSASILGDAAMIVERGLASLVLVFRAMNGRSGHRMGRTALRLGDGGEDQFTLPYGMRGPVNMFALLCRRIMHECGMTEADLAAFVVDSRAKARANPAALRREPFGLADYYASELIASPLRKVDCCQESDGAVAFLVAGARAPAVRDHRPVEIHTVVRGGGPGASSPDRAERPSAIFSEYVAGPLFEAAGLSPGDVDLAELYDAYSFLVPRQIEDFGLAGAGKAADALRAGEFAADGRLPVNLNGGLLSEGYVHGLNNVAAAVRQLRGDAPYGPARPADVALCTGFGGSYGSAAILVGG
jgi:acetyl-CoA acetyltransferase